MAEITLPDGTIVEGAPAGMSANVFMSALKQANPDAYKQILARTAQGDPLKPTPIESVGRGMQDVNAGIKQISGLDPASILPGVEPVDLSTEAADISRYEAGVGEGIDWLRMGGQAAALSPLGAPAAMTKGGLLARSALGAAIGGGSGALLYADSPLERTANTLGSAAGGSLAAAAGPPLMRAAGKLMGGAKVAGQSVLPKQMQTRVTLELDNAAREAGVNLADLSADVADSLRRKAASNLARTGSTKADDLVRQARAARFGFVDDAALTAGQTTRDPTQFSQEQNLSKVEDIGAPLQSRFNNQRAQVGRTLEQFQSDLGGDPRMTSFQAGEAVESAAKNQAAEMQKGVSSAYKAAEAARPDVELSREFFGQRVAQTLDDFEDFIPTSVKKRVAALASGDRSFSPSEAAKLDKLITDTLPSDPFAKRERMAARALQESIADTMEKAGDEAGEFGHLYKAAKAVAAERFKAIGDPNKLTAKLVSSTFDPEKVTRSLMTGSVRQIQNLKRFLPEGSEAWEAAKASVLNQITDDAMASGGFRQATYNRALKRIGRERLELLFGKDGADNLREFGRLAQDLFALPEGHAVNTSNTSAAAANLLSNVVDATTQSVPGGGILSGLRQAGRQAAENSLRARAVAEAITPPTPPIPNLLEPIDDYVRGASPLLGGLLVSDRK